MFKKNVALIMTGAALTAVSMIAMADTVTFNGTTYSCPNSCVINTYPNGGWLVRDSQGAPITIVNPKPGSVQQ
jgi:hypothetical protein